MRSNLRTQNELHHGRKILTCAERIWGWDSHAGRIRAQRRADYLIGLGGINAEKTVLELGCGTGIFTQWFAQTGARISAIDLSPDLLERAKARNLGSRVTFQVGNAEALEFEDESFDCVVGSSVLHHLDLTSALGEIHRLLRPGGIMAFAEPNMMNPQVLLQKNIPPIKRWLGDSPDETAFFRWKMARDLRRIGLTNPRIFPYDFLHPLSPSPLIPAVRQIEKALEKVPIVKEIAGSLLICATKS